MDITFTQNDDRAMITAKVLKTLNRKPNYHPRKMGFENLPSRTTLRRRWWGSFAS
jgi:hypothetical protein